MEDGETYTYEVISKEDFIRLTNNSTGNNEQRRISLDELVGSSNDLNTEELAGKIYDKIVGDTTTIKVRKNSGHCPITNNTIDATSMDKALESNIFSILAGVELCFTGELDCGIVTELYQNPDIRESVDITEVLKNIEIRKNNKFLARLNLYDMELQVMDDVTPADNLSIDLRETLIKFAEENGVELSEENQYYLSLIEEAGPLKIHLRDEVKPQVANPLTSKNIWIVFVAAGVIMFTIVRKRKEKKV